VAVFREIITRLGFKVEDGKLRQTETSVGRVKKQLSLAAKEARRFRQNMNQAAVAGKIAFAVVAAKRALSAITTSYTKPLDEAAKFSRAVGVNVESLQAWGHGAQIHGSSSEAIQKGLRRLSVGMHDARLGSKASVDTFRQLGVQYKTATGELRPLEDTMLDVADRFATMEDGAQKAALAQKLFGKSGAELIPFLNQGRKGIEELSAEARRLGVVMSQDQVAAAEEFNDSLLRAKQAATGLRNQIAGALLPSLTVLMQRFSEWMSTGDNATRVITALGQAATIAGVALGAMAALKIVGVLQSLSAAASAATMMFKLKAMAVGRSTLAMVANLQASVTLVGGLRTLGIVGALVGRSLLVAFGKFALLAAVIGGVVGLLRGEGGELEGVLGSDAVVGLRAAFAELWEAVKPILPYLAKALVVALKGIAFVLKWVVKGLVWIIKLVAKFIAWLAKNVGPVIAWIGRAWEAAGRVAARAWDGLKSVFAWLHRVGATIGRAMGAAWKWAADTARAAWEALIAPFVWLYNKLLAIYDLLDKIMAKGGARSLLSMGHMSAAFAETQQDAAKASRMAATRNAGPPPVNVAGINVAVNSAPTMSPAEVQALVRQGTSDALSDAVGQAYRNRAVAR